MSYIHTPKLGGITKRLGIFMVKASVISSPNMEYEGDAKEAFIAQTSLQVVDCGMVVSHSNPWLGYSPDGVIFEDNRPVALLEVDCLYEGNFPKNFHELELKPVV